MNQTLKALLLAACSIWSAAALAAVDVNTASAADLDSIKGIGPGTTSRIIDARKAGPFKDWTDFVERVRGIGPGNAAKLSGNGLTVNGQTLKATPPVEKPGAKPAAKPAASGAATSTADPAKKP